MSNKALLRELRQLKQAARAMQMWAKSSEQIATRLIKRLEGENPSGPRKGLTVDIQDFQTQFRKSLYK